MWDALVLNDVTPGYIRVRNKFLDSSTVLSGVTAVMLCAGQSKKHRRREDERPSDSSFYYIGTVCLSRASDCWALLWIRPARLCDFCVSAQRVSSKSWLAFNAWSAVFSRGIVCWGRWGQGRVLLALQKSSCWGELAVRSSRPSINKSTQLLQYCVCELQQQSGELSWGYSQFRAFMIRSRKKPPS